MARFLALLFCAALNVVMAAHPGPHVSSNIPTPMSKDIEVDHFWVEIPTLNETQGNAVFMSMQFNMESKTIGYFGTQIWRENADPSSWRNGSKQLLGSSVAADETHKVVFSMWDADATHQVSWEGDNCERFEHDGDGSHCIMTYPLVQGNKYTLRLSLSDDNRKMTGTVTDTSSGSVTTIGTLIFPDVSGLQGLGLIAEGATAFQEYFLSRDCDEHAVSEVGFTGPFYYNRSVFLTSAALSFHAECQHGTCLHDAQGAVWTFPCPLNGWWTCDAEHGCIDTLVDYSLSNNSVLDTLVEYSLSNFSV